MHSGCSLASQAPSSRNQNQSDNQGAKHQGKFFLSTTTLRSPTRHSHREGGGGSSTPVLMRWGQKREKRKKSSFHRSRARLVMCLVTVDARAGVGAPTQDAATLLLPLLHLTPCLQEDWEGRGKKDSRPGPLTVSSTPA